jgi:O-antigen/teichoic acid export membrane protein
VPGRWSYWAACHVESTVSILSVDAEIMLDPAGDGATSTGGDLAQQARSGILWVTGLNVFREALQFGTMLVLVRLLEPKVYGEFSFVSAVMLLFTVLSFRSFFEHTLQLRPHEAVDYQSHFTAAGFMQGAMFVLVNITAAVLNFIPKYAEIAPVLHVMSLFFFFDWAGEFRVKMLQREMNWARLRTLEAIGLLSGSCFALMLALLGYGVYALVLPPIAYTLPFICDLFVSRKWRPDWSWNANHYRTAWNFGLARIASGLLTTGRPLIEGVVVVHLADFSSLGILGRATGLAAVCCQRMPLTLVTAVYPVLTRISRRTELYSRANALILRMISWIVIPAAVLFSLVAGPLVRLLYGPKWDEAIPLLPWALAGGVVAALYQTTTILLLADIRQNRCVVAELLSLVSAVACLTLLLRRGFAAYLSGMAVTQMLTLVWMASPLITGGVLASGTLLRELGTPAVVAGASALLCRAVFTHAAVAGDGSRAWMLIPLLFGTFYLAGLRFLSQDALSEVVDHMPAAVQIRRLLML